MRASAPRRDDARWGPVSESARQALLRAADHLYVPGITPLGEEQARTLQSRARAALRRLQEDPLGADWLAVLDEHDDWRSLPDPDQKLHRERVRQLCLDLDSADGIVAIDQVMQEHYIPIIGWIGTARLWEKLAGEPVDLAFPGNGPVLQPTAELGDTPRGRSRVRKWLVRAASQPVQDQWLTAVQEAASAADRLLNLMITDPLTLGSPLFPSRIPLQGSLRRVSVGNRDLDQWEIFFPTSYTVKRRSRKFGDLEVLYAPDPSDTVVWVTTVRLVEHRRRVHSDQKHRR